MIVGYLARQNPIFSFRSPPRTRRSSASSVGSCAGTLQSQNQQPLSLQIPRSISSNRSRSPTPHHANRLLGEDMKKSGNRSRSPTPQRKFHGNQTHQSADAGKLRSRSPTPKTNPRSRSPTPKVENGKSTSPRNLDPTRKALNEEIRQVKYDGRSQMYHSRHQDNYQVFCV